MDCSSRPKALFVVALGAVAGTLLIVPETSAKAVIQTVPVTQTVAAPPVQRVVSSAKAPRLVAIPLAEVATKAAEVSNFIGTLNAQPPVSTEVKQIQDDFFTLSGQIAADYLVAERTIKEQPTLAKLQAQQQLWQGRQVQFTQWLTILTDRVTQLQGDLTHLDSLWKVWFLTRDGAVAAKAPPQTIQQIETTMAAIRAAQAPVEARSGAVLTIQDLVAKAETRSGQILQALGDAQNKAVGGILAQDSPPVWSVTLRDQARTDLADQIRTYLKLSLDQSYSYFFTASRGLLLQAVILAVLGILFLGIHRRVAVLEASEEVPPAIQVFDRPIAAALVLFFISGSSVNLPVPQGIRIVMEVLAIIPMIRLIQPVLVVPQMVSIFSASGVLFALDTIRQGLAGAPLLEQGFLLAEALTGVALLGWTIRLRMASHEPHALASRELFLGYTLISMAALTVSVAAVSCGYLSLSRLLVSSVLVGGILALGLFTMVRLVHGIAVLAFRSWPLNRFMTVIHYRDLLERRTLWFLVWGACGAWLLRTLDYIGLESPLYRFMVNILEARIKRGEFSISLGDIVAFVVTVWLSFLLSSIIRIILREDVFPRTNVAPGVSYAVTSLLRYSFIVVGFLVALGELGLTLNRVIIFISALGVGIGFGLQNVVNNFISGLILLFERPVHVGDAIEFDTVSGEVREIGIRASKIRSWQGADLIVPNSQLVSERVTNWTLNDRLKRIEIEAGVNYGADASLVIELIEGVARSHPKILASPPSQCLFKGFGDSTINFELRAWTDQFGIWPQIKSELTAGIYRAIQAAGMSFAFPQREVRLINDHEATVAKPTSS